MSALRAELIPIRSVYEYDPPLTVEEFELLPEGEGKQELVDGRVVEMPPVGGIHGLTAGEACAALRTHVRTQNRQEGRVIGYVTIETGYRLFPERRAVRAPDLAFISAERSPRPFPRSLVRAVPDLAIEILSPHDRRRDVQTKVREYLTAGVRLVWVLNPFVDVVVYRADQPLTAASRLRGDDILTGADVLPGFSVAVRDLWPDGSDADDDSVGARKRE